MNNETIEYILQGSFIIDKPKTEEVTNKTKFIGYDYMIKFNTPYEDNNTYPITLYQFLENLCDDLNFELDNNEIVNGEYLVKGNPFTNNETNRFVLGQICQLCAGFAQITPDNKLKIKNLVQNENLDTLDGNIYNSFSKNKKYGKINSVTLNLSDIQGEFTNLKDQESIDENGLTEVVISDNYFLNSAIERQNVIGEIFNTLNGLEYLPFEMEYYGFPYLELGDGVEALDNEDNPYLTYILNYTFKYDGSYSGKLKTESAGDVEQKYNATDTTKNKLRKVERSVDKINGTISDIIEVQDEYEGRMVEVEQDISGLRQEVDSVVSFERNVNGRNQIMLENTADVVDSILKIQIKGNMNYVYPSGTTYPSNTLYPIGQYATIVIDKQEKGNISNEAYKFKIVLLEPLRYMNSSVFDEILFKDKKCQVIRRVGLDNNGNYYEFNTEQITEVGDVNIPSFDGNTYIYVLEHNGLNYDVDYLVKNAYLDTFATRGEVHTKIEQTAKSITSSVNRKLEGYSTTSEMNTAINQTAESITHVVNQKVDETEFGTLVEQNAESVKLAWNQFSQFLQMEILNGNASLVVRDNNNNLLMSIDKNGQHYYTKKNNVDTNIADTVLVDITKNNDTKKSLMFVLDNISMNGRGIMAWGYRANNQIYPVLYIGNFGNEEFGLHVIEDLILKGCAINFGNSNTINSTDSSNIYVKPNTGFYVIDSQNNTLFRVNRNSGKLEINNSSIESDGNNISTKVNGSFKILDAQNNTWMVQIFNEYGEYGFSVKADNFAIMNTNGNTSHISFYDNQAGGKTLNLFNNTLISDKVYADNLAIMDNCSHISVTSAGSGDLTATDKTTGVILHINADWQSDARLKENFETSDIDSLEMINKIQHYSFDWKEDKRHEKIGYIAQELEKIDKDLVKKHALEDEDGNVIDYDWAINERYIIVNLTNAIQQQQEQIDYLYEQLKIEKKKTKRKKAKVKFDYGEKIKVQVYSKLSEVKEKFERRRIKAKGKNKF